MAVIFVLVCMIFLHVSNALDPHSTDTIGQLTDMVTNLTQVVGELNGKIGLLEQEKRDQSTNISTLEQRLSVLEAHEQHAIVAFNAAKSSTANLGDSQLIDFDYVLTNVGKAFDPRHSHFIAPVKGVYVFPVTLASVGHGPRFEVVKNGNAIAPVVSANIHDLHTGSMTVVVSLEINDMVWVRHSPGYSADSIWGDRWSTFSGFLLHRMN